MVTSTEIITTEATMETEMETITDPTNKREAMDMATELFRNDS